VKRYGPGLRDGRCFFEAQRGGLPDKSELRSTDVIGEPAVVARDLSENFIARPEITNMPADLLDSPGDVRAENPVTWPSKATDPSVQWAPAYSFAIGSIDGSRENPDEDLSIGRSGLGHLFDPNNVREAVFGANNGAHCRKSHCRRRSSIHERRATIHPIAT